MSKKKKEVNVETTTVVETENNEIETEEVKVKTKMSLKKKLIIGGGVLAGLVIGAIALGSKKGDSTTISYDSSEDDVEVEDDYSYGDDVENGDNEVEVTTTDSNEVTTTEE